MKLNFRLYFKISALGPIRVIGYSSFYYLNEKGTEINALQHFFMSIYDKVENYIVKCGLITYKERRKDYFPKQFDSYQAFSLFDM